VIDPQYLDVTVLAQEGFTHAIKRGHNSFAYVIDGNGLFEDGQDAFAHEVVGKNYFYLDRQCLCDSGTLILYEDGGHLSITAKDETLRFLLVSGRPIREPVAWYGPIVMNTQEELREAIEDCRSGKFNQRAADFIQNRSGNAVQYTGAKVLNQFFDV
jgi:redox-sensitive bicupin YhaK (pirin superfamily)